MCTRCTPVSKYGASSRTPQRDLHMHKCIPFHPSARSSPLHTSPTQQWQELPRGAASCRLCTFFSTAGFHISQSDGLDRPPPPQQGRTHAGKAGRDGQRGASGRGGGQTDRFCPETPGWVSGNRSRREGTGGSLVLQAHLGETLDPGPSIGLPPLPVCTAATFLSPLITGDSMCVSPYVAACIRARRCVRVWLRYVILCGPQLLCHTAVHDGGERSRLPPPAISGFACHVSAPSPFCRWSTLWIVPMWAGPLCKLWLRPPRCHHTARRG